MKGYESYHYGQVKPDENDIKDHPLITTPLRVGLRHFTCMY